MHKCGTRGRWVNKIRRDGLECERWLMSSHLGSNHIGYFEAPNDGHTKQLSYIVWYEAMIGWYKSGKCYGQPCSYGCSSVTDTGASIATGLRQFTVIQWDHQLIRYHDHMRLWPGSLTHCGLVTPYGDKSGSTLAQVMACCLMAPSHYLNQCWFIISRVQWHPSESNFTRNTSVISHWN